MLNYYNNLKTKNQFLLKDEVHRQSNKNSVILPFELVQICFEHLMSFVN